MRISFVLLIAALFLQSCDKDDLCLKGSGKINNYPIQVTEFNSVSLSGPVNLRVEHGAQFEVSVDAEPEMFAYVDYSVSGGVLDIGIKRNVRCFETVHGVWVNVTVPDLRYVYVNGDSEILSVNELNLERLKIDVSGVADLNMRGHVKDFILESDGITKGNNLNFLTDTTNLDIAGAANIGLSCTDKMHIKVNGSAVVRYSGDPAITQDVSGALELIKVD